MATAAIDVSDDPRARVGGNMPPSIKEQALLEGAEALKPLLDRAAELLASASKAKRNWKIWRLRGLYWNAHLLTEERRARALEQIDAELIALGAEPQSDRVAREAEERRAKFYRMSVISKLLRGEPIF